MSINGVYHKGELYRQMWLNGELIWKCSDSLFPYAEDCVLTYVNNANVRIQAKFEIIDETKPYSINGVTTNNLYFASKEKRTVKLVNLKPYSTANFFPVSIEQLRLPTITDLSGLFRYFCRVADYSYSWSPKYFELNENPTSMKQMFSDCAYLTQEMWEQFMPYFPNTSNVTDMSYMFQGCKVLDSLDLSSWDVSKVENFSYMFNNTYIKSLNLSNWDMSKFGSQSSYFTTRGEMFSDNIYLETVNVSNWKLPTDSLKYFLYGCPARKIVGLDTWNTSTITDMSHMFRECINLTEFDVSHFNTANVVTMDRMFYGSGSDYYGFETLDLSSWNVSNVQSMYYMFNGCSHLRTINTTGWNISNVEQMDGMFGNCQYLQSFDMSNWNVLKTLSADGMFENCRALRSVNTSGLVSTTWVRFKDMFKNCSLLRSIDFSGIKTQTWSVDGMFNGCTNIKTINISGFDTTYQASQMVLDLYDVFTNVTKCDIYLSNAWTYDTDANCYGGIDNNIIILETFDITFSMGENMTHICDYSPANGMTSIYLSFMETVDDYLTGEDIGLFGADGVLIARGNFSYSIPITGCYIDLVDTGIETNTTLNDVYLARLYFEPIYQVYREGIPRSNSFAINLVEN